MYRIYFNFTYKKLKMSICDQLVLEPLGSWSFMPKILPGHWQPYVQNVKTHIDRSPPLVMSILFGTTSTLMQKGSAISTNRPITMRNIHFAHLSSPQIHLKKHTWKIIINTRDVKCIHECNSPRLPFQISKRWRCKGQQILPCWYGENQHIKFPTWFDEFHCSLRRFLQ